MTKPHQKAPYLCTNCDERMDFKHYGRPGEKNDAIRCPKCWTTIGDKMINQRLAEGKIAELKGV